ncbi:hypothetical protein [Maribacter aquivivus]|uniref:hypothetical protein n=1 Tax=Maribacter aquivivus TaxID=228958 RepID=UPI002491790C|nr:hypothetical protein [Maribacter aquivivus]
MDYHRIYIDHIISNFEELKALVFEVLNKGKKSHHAFDTTFDEILDSFFPKKNQLKKKIRINGLDMAIHEFDNWQKKYVFSKGLELAINIDLHEFYLTNINFKGIFTEENFEEFLKDFAFINTVTMFTKVLYDKKLVLIEFYKSNDMTTLSDEDISLTEAIPEELPQIIKDPEASVTTNKIESNIEKNTQEKSIEQILITNNIKKFKTKEKIILLHILYEFTKGDDGIINLDSLSLTDFLKIIAITKDICDITLFESRAGVVSYYNNISTGVNKYNKNQLIKILNQISDKLEVMKITKFAEVVREYPKYIKEKEDSNKKLKDKSAK